MGDHSDSVDIGLVINEDLTKVGTTIEYKIADRTYQMKYMYTAYCQDGDYTEHYYQFVGYGKEDEQHLWLLDDGRTHILMRPINTPPGDDVPYIYRLDIDSKDTPEQVYQALVDAFGDYIDFSESTTICVDTLTEIMVS